MVTCTPRKPDHMLGRVLSWASKSPNLELQARACTEARRCPFPQAQAGLKTSPKAQLKCCFQNAHV